MLNAIAKHNHPFAQTGSVSKLSFSLNEFIALNISMVTRIESETVVAALDISLVNIPHPSSGKRVELL